MRGTGRALFQAGTPGSGCGTPRRADPDPDEASGSTIKPIDL